MNRLVTYTIAATVGVLIAALLSIPSIRMVREWKLTHPVSPPVAMEIAQPAAPPATPAVENQTLLTAGLSSGTLAVTVNGAAAGSLQGATQLDITSFCRPGANVVRLMWVGPTQGSVTATRTLAGVSRSVADVLLVPADTGNPGVREVTFYQ